MRKIEDKNANMGKFDPRNPETYQFATENQLVIDGVKIFDTYYDDAHNEIKEPQSERYFTDVLSVSLSIFIKSNPDIDVQNYIDEYVNRSKYECTEIKMSTFTYGGYNFSEAQMEIMRGISDDKRVKIGEILTEGMTKHKRSYQIKQTIFNTLGIDGEYITNLCNADVAQERNIMRDYFLGFEDFESEDEVYTFFDKSSYLKNNPELKREILDNALSWFENTEGED
jgi:hypothetical protein